MPHYFISDLHLSPEQPETVELFKQFIQQHKDNMESLFILGDFFEYWVGDDDLNDWNKPLLQLLKDCPNVSFLAGNRDFLLSQKCLQQFKIKLIEDNHILTVNNVKILLAHGDQLCTDDIKYQEFRTRVRTLVWKNEFLSKSLKERHNIVLDLRDKSKKAIKAKSENIMDVNEITVSETFNKYAVNTLIHGHTHRPTHHQYPNNKNRYVLGAWHNSISYLTLEVKDKKPFFKLVY